MNINDLRSKLIDLDVEIRDELITPYRFSKIVNETLDLNLPPQMFYNYVRNSMIDVVVVNEKKLIKKTTLLEFIERYALRNVVTVS